MEIIRRGKLPGHKEHQVECDECSTVFRFMEKEARIEYDQRDGNALVVACPVCGKEIWIAHKT